LTCSLAPDANNQDVQGRDTLSTLYVTNATAELRIGCGTTLGIIHIRMVIEEEQRKELGKSWSTKKDHPRHNCLENHMSVPFQSPPST
jgi:hypothetical protein